MIRRRRCRCGPARRSDPTGCEGIRDLTGCPGIPGPLRIGPGRSGAGLAVRILRAAVCPHRHPWPIRIFSNQVTYLSPVTESKRRASPYHASRFRLTLSHQVGLPQVRRIPVSGCVADEHQVEQANRHKPAILPVQRPPRLAYSQVSYLCPVLEPHTHRPSAIGRLSIHGAPYHPRRHGAGTASRPGMGNHHTCRVTREPAKTTRSRRHGLNSPQIIARTSRPAVTNGARRRRGCFRGVLSAANDQEAAMTYFRSQL